MTAARPGRPLAVVLHQLVGEGAAPDELDVLAEAGLVERLLADLGHDVVRLQLSLDLAGAARELRRLDPLFVFNLVESLDGSNQLVYLAPSLLEHLGVPFTGASSATMYQTTHKILAKTIMRANGIPTPRWATLADLERGDPGWSGPAIVKPAGEDASIGIDDRAVFADVRDAAPALREAAAAGRALFAEEYVEGREVNLAVLARAGGHELLPPAEIDFSAFPPGRARILTYDAKWVEGSFDYENTPRTFRFGAADGALLARLREISVACWQTFGMRGWGRVDFRVSAAGEPYVLEVNANPCLAPDGGFQAAVEEAGHTPEQVVARIVADRWGG